MHAWRRLAGVAAVALVTVFAGHGFAAGPQGTVPLLSGEPGDERIVVTDGAGHSSMMTPATLAGFPAVSLTLSFETGHGPQRGRFTGPLLWAVLSRCGVIGAGAPRTLAHETVLVTGSDGYMAALAMGEIAPVFEGKQVILVDEMDGHPLAPGHFRIIVPGDRYGARDVRDVVRIRVLTTPP